LDSAELTPKTQHANSVANGDATGGSRFSSVPALQALYGLAMVAAISTWFIAIRAPLWLDETISVWQIDAGFSQILSRQGGLSFPAYPFILWFSSKLFGKSEIGLRIPEILAMLAAVYLLYRAARELFDRDDVAIIAAVVFTVHPLVIFAAIDVRPYAFGALAINAAILVLVRLRSSNSLWLAALFGALGACIVYFHFLLIVILPALLLCFIALKLSDRKALLRQGAVALAAFAVAFLPVIPGLLYMFHTKSDHVFDAAPQLSDLLWTLAPEWIAYIFIAALLSAAATSKLELQPRFDGKLMLLCASLGLIPILILYGVSAETSIHVFVDRYRLVAIPGIALCWAWLVSRIDSRALRLLFCFALVASIAYPYYGSPATRTHGYSWKYALEAAEKDASTDNATVLICSDLPEADHVPMPAGAAVKDSNFFSPLSYYKLSVPVVGLPRVLNQDARRIVSNFLPEAAQRHERFLAVAFKASYPTLQFIVSSSAGTHSARVLGTFDGVEVVEFTPLEER